MKKFYNRQFANNYEELISYYPRYYRDVREMVAILKANGKLLDGVQDAIEGIYTSGFIDSMDETAISEFERFLHIRTRSQRTLEERRRLIKSYIIGFGKVSATLLSDMLQAYTGSPSDIKFEPFDYQRNNKLYISTSPQNDFFFFASDVLDILSKKVPAHIPFSITFTYQPEAPPAYIAVAQYSAAMSCTVRLPGVIQPRAVGATAYAAGAAASARMMAAVEIPGIITPKSVSAQAYAAGRLAHTRNRNYYDWRTDNVSWEKSSYTKAGAALLSEALSGGALTITRAVSGTGSVDTDLSAETAVSGDTHELSLLGIETVTDDGKTARKVSIQVTGAADTYVMHQIGVYGRLNDDAEVLLFIMQDERGIEVPSSGANAEFEIEISVLLAVSDKANIGITLTPQMQAIMRMVQKYIREHCVQLNSYSLTLAADGWTMGDTPGYPYQYTAQLADAKETDMPTAQPEISSLTVAEDAGLASVCETADGSITFWAESNPEVDIQMQVTLLGQAKAGTVSDTTSMLGQAILGSLVLNT